MVVVGITPARPRQRVRDLIATGLPGLVSIPVAPGDEEEGDNCDESNASSSGANSHTDLGAIAHAARGRVARSCLLGAGRGARRGALSAGGGG